MPHLEASDHFIIQEASVHVRFSSEVLELFERHLQDRCFKREAGGQLFAVITGRDWIIARATGPRRSDKRGRYFIFPNRKAEQTEIDALFSEGLHYVGDWHTHPEREPEPSPTDFDSMDEMTRLSRFELPGLLMVIVGTKVSREGLWMSFHPRGLPYTRLQPQRI